MGGAAGCTTDQDLCDQITRLERRMKELEKERDGGVGKAGSKKEKDQVCQHNFESVDKNRASCRALICCLVVEVWLQGWVSKKAHIFSAGCRQS